MYNLFTLDNGLRVVFENIDYFNSISVGLWIESGSRNEVLATNGISHFIEHMLFKGTENRTAKQIAEDIEDVGGQINAFTGKETTCFYIKALDTHLELSLDILSDMLFNSKFATDDIEKEKGVVIEEISMSEDSPEDVLSELHNKATWGEDSISFPILGSIENVKSFTKQQLKSFVSTHYVPENSVISICGKFDVKNTTHLISKYFGAWCNNFKSVTTYSTPSIISDSLYKVKNIEQLHLSLGLEGLPVGDKDSYALLLLNNILGGGASSLLFQKVREDHGLCYSIYSYMSSFKNTGVIGIYTSLSPNCAGEALNLIKSEIENFAKNGVSNEKLLKAKEQIKGSYILGLESTSSRMFSNGKSVLFLRKINDPKEVMLKIDKIDITDLIRVTEKTFKNGILNSAFVGAKLNMELYNNILHSDTVAFNNCK